LRSISRIFYNSADGVVLAYDITRPESFTNVQSWLKEVLLYAPENIEKVLIGNKSDLTSEYINHQEESHSRAGEAIQ
jgi:Ras-related protein Rab-1A